MMKILLQTVATIAVLFMSLLNEKMPKKVFRALLICIVVLLVVNGGFMYNDDKKSNKAKMELNNKMDDLSKGSICQQEKIDQLLLANFVKENKIDDLIAMNNVQQGKINDLKSMIGDQSSKIDELNQRIAQLVKLLEGISVATLEKTDSYVKAKNIYDSALSLMNQGNQREAAHKFLEFREIAIKEGAYEAAAISSLIASYRFEDIGEETKAAQLQSEAGDFFIKLNHFNEAKVWKKNAKELYEQQGLTTEAISLGREIKTLELRLK